MMPSSPASSLAIHEAGHAVAAMLLGIAVDGVGLDPRGGETAIAAVWRLLRSEDGARKVAVIALAGEAATRLAGRRPDNGIEVDLRLFTAAQDAVRSFTGRDDLMLFAVLDDARDLLRPHWPTVDALARRLDSERYLTGAAVAQLVRQCGRPDPTEGDCSPAVLPRPHVERLFTL